MKQDQRSSSNLGSSSLLVIFGVVCFAMLALLSLNTVLAQQRMNQGAMKGEMAYWAADLEAETIFARLRAGELPPEVTQKDGVCFYQCPISQYQSLHVEIKETQNGWEVLRWQAVAFPEITEENLPVWGGG